MTAAKSRDADLVPLIALLVADLPRLATDLSARLQSAGFWVSLSDPAESLDAAAELRPDLVVVTGERFDAVCQRLRSDERTATIPIVRVGKPGTTEPCADAVMEADAPVERLLEIVRNSRARHEPPPARTSYLKPPAAPVVAAIERPCPGCAARLTWVERSRLYGVEYDYYRWCPNGCGLFCYDVAAGAWSKLA